MTVFSSDLKKFKSIAESVMELHIDEKVLFNRFEISRLDAVLNVQVSLNAFHQHLGSA